MTRSRAWIALAVRVSPVTFGIGQAGRGIETGPMRFRSTGATKSASGRAQTRMHRAHQGRDVDEVGSATDMANDDLHIKRGLALYSPLQPRQRQDRGEW